MNSVTILVDVQNIYYTSRQAYGKSFDYNAFWAQVTAGRTVNKAIAYAIDRGDEKQRQFQNILRAIGFEVQLKPFIQRADGSAKGDWDVGITLDAIEYGQHSEVLVLASGDGDFALLAERLISKYQTEVEVYGVPSLTAQALVNAASRFIAIDQQLLLA
ncbi:NYN domain-containing protein [Arsukibacterium sp.]|uniref:NYN domain-containing protein n=1 Tax=Arsukibacterium sp. TaxID=1977258 RepID=UPI00299D38D6|nr:NYN domain-containing protein [Arsukibacterium sp.]MDX1677754.1 NYN domain-containing protein [Arsukibacterium sp.]